MSRRTAHWMTTVAAVFALGASTAGCSTSDEPAGSLEPVDLVPALASSQTSQDEIPTNLMDDHIDADSTRLLGANNLGKYWVALSDKGICLVAGLPDEAEGDFDNIKVSGTGCSGPSKFAEQGISLSLRGQNVAGITAFLLPNDVDPASVDNVVETARNETDGTIDHFDDAVQLITTSRHAGSAFSDVDVERTAGDPLTLRYP